MGGRPTARPSTPVAWTLDSDRGPYFPSATPTRIPSRSLNDPAAATCSPALSPETISTSSPTTVPVSTGRLFARGFPSGPGAMMKTWSPCGPFRRAADRDRHGRHWRTDRHPDADRGPRGRAAGGYLDAGPHHGVPGGWVDLGVHGLDPGRDRRPRADEQVHSVPGLQADGHRLRDREVHVHCWIHALERRELSALVQVLARVDVREADASLERGSDGLAGDDRLGPGDLGQGDVPLGPRLIDFLLGHGHRLVRPPGPREDGLGQGQLRPCAFSSASSTETSRATSTAPASTTWPGVSVTSRTVPGSSFLSVMERKAMTVPMAVVVRRCSRSVAIATVTASIGSGWSAAAAMAFWMVAYFQAPSPTATPSTLSSRSIDAIQPRRLMSLSPGVTAGYSAVIARVPPVRNLYSSELPNRAPELPWWAHIEDYSRRRDALSGSSHPKPALGEHAIGTGRRMGFVGTVATRPQRLSARVRHRQDRRLTLLQSPPVHERDRVDE